VAPMMMGLGDGVLLFSLTGKQKKRNLERDPRATVSLAEAGTLAHVIAWGSVGIRHDEEAQVLWAEMIKKAFGDSGYVDSSRPLSLEETSLGVMTVTRHRIYGIE